MKSRKIWSIPIALAVVLMLVASLGVSSLVMAQSSGTKTVTGGGDKFKDAKALKVTDVITTIGIPEKDNNLLPEKGLEGHVISGFALSGADASLFEVSDKGEVTVKDKDVALVAIQDASKKAVFTFEVSVYVDTDAAKDTGKGYRDPDPIKVAADPDNPDQPGGTGNDQKDDRDEVNKTTVTLYAFKFDRTDLEFETAKPASVGERLYGADGADKAVTVKGIPSGGKLTGTAGTYFSLDVSGSMFYIVHGSKPADAETGTVKINLDVDPDGDGTEAKVSLTEADASVLVRDELKFDTIKGPKPISIQITDIDGTVKDATAFVFTVQSNARNGELVGNIPIMGATGSDSDNKPPIPTERIGAVVSPSSVPFDVEAEKSSGDEYNRVRLSVDGALPASTATRYDFQVSISGQGPARRTAIMWVRVNVSAADAGPELKAGVVLNADGKYEVTVPENVMAAGTLLKQYGDDEGSAADHLVGASGGVIDFSALVEDSDSDADELTYVVTPASSVFDVDVSDGKLVLRSGDVSATPGNEDDLATATVDESKFFGPRTDDGKLVGADAKTRQSTNRNADITYDFTVTVTDEAGNTKPIPVLLTLDVNEPAGPDMASADRIAAEYSSNDPIGHEIYDLNTLIDDPDDDPLDYTLVVITDDPATTAVEGGSDLPVPFNIDSSGMIEANWTGLRVEEDIVWHINVTIDDPYENTAKYDDDGKADTPAAKCCFRDAVVPLQITLLAPEPQEAGDLSYTVEEHADAGTTVGSVAKDENGAPVISDAANYSITHATGGAAGADGAAGTADDDFELLELNDDVFIVVKKGRDFEGDDKIAMPNTLTLIVEATGPANEIRGQIIVGITVINVNEAPTFMAAAPDTLPIDENAQPGATVGMPITASDVDAGDSVSYSITETNVPFSVNSAGQISVSGALVIKSSPYTVTLVATDSGGLMDTHSLEIAIGDVNDPPTFDDPSAKTATIPENVAAGTVVATYNATDVDDAGDDVLQGVEYVLRDADDLKNFTITNTNVAGQIVGELKVKTGANLDVDAAGAATEYSVEVNVCDADTACNELIIKISVTDVNDNTPVFNSAARDSQSVDENTARGTMLGNYSATDADASAAFNTVSYDLSGLNGKSFDIDADGTLRTLESLDAEFRTPCGPTGCSVEVIASDGENSVSMDVVITVSNAEDSVSTFKITKANPVPGVTMGEPNSALADTKASISSAVPERPADLPATMGDGPDKFVETQWANWGTVLRIAVTSPFPNADCRGGNECVFVMVESDNHKLKLEAYRSDTPAGATTRENLFIAAVKVVSGEGEGNEEDAATDPDGDGTVSVYKHGDGSVTRLEADEEDEISIRLVGSTAPPITIDVENEKPEFGNFMPEHESAFDDADVDYTFTIIDPVSGIPEPEDLPDVDGDGDYMPMVAVISDKQCKIIELDADGKRTVPKGYTEAKDLHADADLYCQGQPELRQVVDDRDFDEIDEGFDIDTKIVLRENEERFVSFIVCDAAGNCAMYTPDENNEDEALAQITIDTIKPGGEDGDKIEVRTGIKWDSTDNKYDDDRTYIQVIFEDLTPLNEDTIEVDDFVVEGHTIKSVKWYDFDANDDDADWSTRFDKGGPTDGETKDPMFKSIDRSVFIELEDELAPDETPDVTVVPNGIEDSAGNEQDDGDKEADDWIAPSFTVTSIVSPRTPEGSSNVLAGDGDEVVITLTSDERIQQTRPNVSVTHVNAPASSVYTSTSREYCDNADGIGKGTRIRGEIRNSADCLDSDAASGGPLGTSIEKVSNTEWIITVNEPDATGYYSFYVSGQDRSEQNNPGSEGVAPDDLVKDFFERDGDVNSDDAHYFQGDINLSNPGVRVSGVQIEDTEPAVEFKTPLFVELDFTRGYIGDCDGITDNDEKKANCRNEKEEYAKDSFENVTVTSFVLNGVDMTDSVKTTDDKTFLVSIESINIGDHEIEIQAMDQAGNTLDEVLSIEFEVEERDPFSRRLNPGWNLVSLPGEPADSDISVVFDSNVEVRTVYTYDPIIPGGWMVAVRETLDSAWQGDLMDITARRGYWVLSDAIQDWEVSIPRLAGGAVGSGTPIQPPVIGLYAGWNLIPVVDVRGGALDDGKSISATAYLNSLDDGLDLARVLGFNTITNTWTTVLDPDDTSDDAGELRIGSGYWVFVREAASLVPGGIAQ